MKTMDIYQWIIIMFAVSYMCLYAVREDPTYLIVSSIFQATSFLCCFIASNKKGLNNES